MEIGSLKPLNQATSHMVTTEISLKVENSFTPVIRFESRRSFGSDSGVV